MTQITAVVKLADSIAKEIKWFSGLSVVGLAKIDGKEVLLCRPIRRD